MEKELAYLAGAIDCDGSIAITISNIHNKNVESVGFTFNVNLRQAERGREIIELAYEIFGGKIYRAKNSDGMLTWQTTNQPGAKKVLELLLPYLIVKKLEANLMLSAIELLQTTERIKGLSGRPRIPLEIKKRVIEISDSMNITTQKESSRRNRALRDKLKQQLES